MADDFTPLGQGQATQGQDDFQPLPQSGAPAKATPQPKGKEPGYLEQAYDFMGRGPGVAATGASLLAAALAPETGGLSLLIPAAVGGTTAMGVSALQGDKDPITTGLTTFGGDLLGGVGSKAVGWAGGKLASKFELGKYVGNVGKTLADVWNMPQMKTYQDIYNAIHAGGARQAITDAYKGAEKQIFDVIGADTPITGAPAKYLNRIYYDHVPEFKQFVDAIVSNAQAKRGGGFVSKYSSFAKGNKQQSADLLNQALETLPISTQNAMEYARQLGGHASRAPKNAVGFGLREANHEAREAIAGIFDNLAPGQNMGTVYRDMNMNYRRGVTALDAFGEPELTKVGPKGPMIDRVEWQKASNNAFKKLHDVDLDHVDSVVRMGRQPGATGETLKMRGHTPGVGGFRAWLPDVQVENPLRPEPKISSELLRKIFKGTPGALGANVGEQFGSD